MSLAVARRMPFEFDESPLQRWGPIVANHFCIRPHAIDLRWRPPRRRVNSICACTPECNRFSVTRWHVSVRKLLPHLTRRLRFVSTTPSRLIPARHTSAHALLRTARRPQRHDIVASTSPNILNARKPRDLLKALLLIPRTASVAIFVQQIRSRSLPSRLPAAIARRSVYHASAFARTLAYRMRIQREQNTALRHSSSPSSAMTTNRGPP